MVGGKSLDVDRSGVERRLDAVETAVSRFGDQSKSKGEKSGSASSALLIAIITGSLGIFGALAANFLQARSAAALEEQRFRSSLVLKAIETGSREGAARNLLFLLEIGLLDDPSGRIAELRNSPNNSPVLPVSGGAVQIPEASRIDFIREYRAQIGPLDAAGEANLRRILDHVERDRNVDDVRYVAFLLAVAKQETQGSFQPLSEFGSDAVLERRYGSHTARGRRLGNTEPGDGARYRGRGYVQLTGKQNYARMNTVLGIGGTPDDLVAHPERALDPVISYRIMSELVRGAARRFFNNQGADYASARRVISGPVQTPASFVQDARRLESILTQLLRRNAAR